jgi:hypothetical protein
MSCGLLMIMCPDMWFDEDHVSFTKLDRIFWFDEDHVFFTKFDRIFWFGTSLKP